MAFNISAHLLLLSLLIAGFHSTAQDSIDQFKWLEGEWVEKQGNTETHETWRTISPDLMMADNYTKSGDKVVFRETIRIERIADYWCFITSVNGGQPVLFTLIDSDGKWVFENKEHDFPQRVVYSQKPDGTLSAWIEGKEKGKDKRIPFDMVRVVGSGNR